MCFAPSSDPSIPHTRVSDFSKRQFVLDKISELLVSPTKEPYKLPDDVPDIAKEVPLSKLQRNLFDMVSTRALYREYSLNWSVCSLYKRTRRGCYLLCTLFRWFVDNFVYCRSVYEYGRHRFAEQNRSRIDCKFISYEVVDQCTRNEQGNCFILS